MCVSICKSKSLPGHMSVSASLVVSVSVASEEGEVLCALLNTQPTKHGAH